MRCSENSLLILPGDRDLDDTDHRGRSRAAAIDLWLARIRSNGGGKSRKEGIEQSSLTNCAICAKIPKIDTLTIMLRERPVRGTHRHYN